MSWCDDTVLGSVANHFSRLADASSVVIELLRNSAKPLQISAEVVANLIVADEFITLDHERMFVATEFVTGEHARVIVEHDFVIVNHESIRLARNHVARSRRHDRRT